MESLSGKATHVIELSVIVPQLTAHCHSSDPQSGVPWWLCIYSLKVGQF